MSAEAKTTPELSGAKRALLQRYLRGGLRAGTKTGTIPKRKESGPAPLSYSQQQVWLHSQLAGDTLIYNEPETIHLPGELNLAALERAFTEIVRRHEAWRTTFEWSGDEGVQVVHPAPKHIEIPFVELRVPPKEREREAISLATADALLPFDLARGPMYRLLLVRVGEADHRLFLTLHHIIFDGVSLYRVFLPELQTLYDAFVNNETPVLAELPIQYPDYATWQRTSVKAIAPEHLAYWQTVLTNLPTLDLPTDRPRPARQTYAGASELLQVPAETTAALKALSQEQGATPFMTMVAAFLTLLHQHTEQEDIVIGGITSGRPQTETMGLLGSFMNTVPIRCAFSKDRPFTDLLARVRSATLDALAHDEVPFELLVQKFAQPRDPSRAPLLQVLLVVEPPLETLKNGWRFTHMDVETGAAKFDLQLGLDDRPEGLTGRFTYNTDLFDRSTIELMKSRWVELLDRIATTRTTPVRDLILGGTCFRMSKRGHGENEEQQPLPEWNATRTNYPRDAAIHELFEQQARRTPPAIALVFGDVQLSYDELNRRANCLARRLRKLGVTRDQPVGVHMERSTELVVALLAILKAGGAYLPLDPTYPAERRALMVNDAQASVILTQAAANEAQGEPDDGDLGIAVRADDLAYIMYTSGSTGVPKGVAVPHRAVVRLVQETDYASFSADETFLQLAPISFDASSFEIWGALLNGGKLVIMPSALPTLEEIGTTIREQGVTTLWLTSALFNAMVDERPQDLRPLRQLLAGGDVLSVPHVQKVLRECKETRLINGYGPTESTTFACCYTIPSDAPRDGSIPIGRPIANTTAHILDANLQPVPVGVSGDLYLGGDGLARGYWRREELTAEKFIADPFSDKPGARIYKTGDLARWRNDGVIEFLGRADHQIKLRGFRIEPGEIETALKQQPDVLDSAVIMREDLPNDKRLVGYVVCQPSILAAFEQALVIAALKKTLPDYMVPSSIVALPALPRTPNGKLDRKALPSPPATSDFVAPKTPFEEKLVGIWAGVLGVERIGVNDNFFDLGGHSLLGLRLVNQLGATLGEQVPLTMIFEAPTVAGMAQLLARRAPSAKVPSLAPIVSVNRESRRARRL